MVEFKDSSLMNEYHHIMSDIVKTTLPTVSKKKIDKFVWKEMDKSFKNANNVQIHNNYVHKTIGIDLLSLTEFIRSNKPILAGGGMLYKNQDQEWNPNARMLESFQTARGLYKKLLKVYKEDTFEYNMANLKQMNEKVNINAFYGCSGAKSSRFFNIYNAAATTLSGQLLISTTEQAFEAFLTGGFKFESMNEMYTFMYLVLNEKYRLKDDFLHNVTVAQTIARLRGLFYRESDFNEDLAFMYLANLEQSELNRIYYKNNLYEFCLLPKIHDIISDVLLTVDEFMDPNSLPEPIVDPLRKLYKFIKEFVFHNHMPNDRVERVKRDVREAVVHADTDSNMIYLFPWVDFCDTEFFLKHSRTADRDLETNVMIAINAMAFILTSLVTDVLSKFSDNSNILKSYAHNLNMKNEFLFMKMGFTDKKKRYFSSNRLKEGKLLDPYIMDIKGLDFMKSTTSKRTKNRMIDILKSEVIEKDDIEIPKIFTLLEEMSSEIIDSLKSKSKEYLIPTKVNEVESYTEPFSQSQVKAAYVWNAIFPDKEIQFPIMVDIAKVNMSTLEDVEMLKDTNPEIYHNIKTKLFEGNVEVFRKKGIERIAVPTAEIPDWLLPFIDYEGIANDNVSRFMPVARSIGINVLSTSRASYYTNIIPM